MRFQTSRRVSVPFPFIKGLQIAPPDPGGFSLTLPIITSVSCSHYSWGSMDTACQGLPGAREAAFLATQTWQLAARLSEAPEPSEPSSAPTPPQLTSGAGLDPDPGDAAYVLSPRRTVRGGAALSRGGGRGWRPSGRAARAATCREAPGPLAQTCHRHLQVSLETF